MRKMGLYLGDKTCLVKKSVHQVKAFEILENLAIPICDKKQKNTAN